jgi:hypothetical protein
MGTARDTRLATGFGPAGEADTASATHPLVNQLVRLRNPVSQWHWNVAGFASPSPVPAADFALVRELFAGPLQPSDLLLELVAAARASEWEQVGILIARATHDGARSLA